MFLLLSSTRKNILDRISLKSLVVNALTKSMILYISSVCMFTYINGTVQLKSIDLHLFYFLDANSHSNIKYIF